MDWRYRSNPVWLDARHKLLTATDFIELKSSLAKASKAALDGEVVLPAFAAAWMRNSSEEPMLEDDLWSYGAAARGHLLEPYAASLYSKYEGKKYYHWDDVVVSDGLNGFSPDAVLDMKCPEPGEFKFEDFNAKEILEIKCYGLDNHGKAFGTNPGAMKERFQIAWAMFVCPSIERGILLFYNPSAAIPMLPVIFTREDLAKEIELAEQVSNLYEKTCFKMETKAGWSGPTNYLSELCDTYGKDELTIWSEVTG